MRNHPDRSRATNKCTTELVQYSMIPGVLIQVAEMRFALPIDMHTMGNKWQVKCRVRSTPDNDWTRLVAACSHTSSAENNG